MFNFLTLPLQWALTLIQYYFCAEALLLFRRRFSLRVVLMLQAALGLKILALNGVMSPFPTMPDVLPLHWVWLYVSFALGCWHIFVAARGRNLSFFGKPHFRTRFSNAYVALFFFEPLAALGLCGLCWVAATANTPFAELSGYALFFSVTMFFALLRNNKQEWPLRIGHGEEVDSEPPTEQKRHEFTFPALPFRAPAPYPPMPKLRTVAELAAEFKSKHPTVNA